MRCRTVLLEQESAAGALLFTSAEKLWAFRKATDGFALRHVAPGITDDELYGIRDPADTQLALF